MLAPPLEGHPLSPGLTFGVNDLEGSIIDRFHHVVSCNSSHIAIHHMGKATTYGELNVRSNMLANFLSATLEMKQQPVALMFTQGLEHHVCQLAVLKTRGFYSNIDSSLTSDRQLLVLTDLGAIYLLHDSASEKKASQLAAHVPGLTVVNTESLELGSFSAGCPAFPINATDYATIVYTSGSTGPPQGVLLTHQNILHIARSHGRDFPLSGADRAAQICGLWTGASTSEVYSALLNGSTLYPYSVQTNGLVNFCKLLTEASITTMVAAPVLFRALMRAADELQFPTVRLIRLGGDLVTDADVALLRRHFAKSCRLRIAYGSTEFIPATQIFIEPDYQAPARIPVGSAIEGCEVRIVDENGGVLDAGQVGEIEIVSKYLSPGYWNNPRLTAERYVDEEGGMPKRYRTRDLGYLDASGSLYHVGRKDARVKIHGKLVLTTDVERALTAIWGIKEAAVVSFRVGLDPQLAAFLVSDTQSSELAIRGELLKVMPAEIIPKRFLFVPELPLLPNNKVDRTRLQQMAGTIED